VPVVQPPSQNLAPSQGDPFTERTLEERLNHPDVDQLSFEANAVITDDKPVDVPVVQPPSQNLAPSQGDPFTERTREERLNHPDADKLSFEGNSVIVDDVPADKQQNIE
jgi:hypothetical protein